MMSYKGSYPTNAQSLPSVFRSLLSSHPTMNLMFEQEKDPARVITKATKVRVLCLAATECFCGPLLTKSAQSFLCRKRKRNVL